jgi:SAM-dependent methyltransferase
LSDPFDRNAGSYEADVERSIAFAPQEHAFFIKLKTDALLDLVERRLGDPGRLSALDAGCGIGLADAQLALRFATVTGVDTSEPAIARARQENPGVDYAVQDAARLPFDEGSFDVAFAICVLHHVPPAGRPALTAELARVTRPGGIVAVFEHNPHNPLTRLAVSRCPFDEDAVLLRPGEVGALFAHATLEPLEQRYIVFFPWALPALRKVERVLAPLPLGAQYYVAGRKPS